MPIPLINPSVTTVLIENNIRKTPTVWADEARHEIMSKVILSAPMSDDPMMRDMAMANRARFEDALFQALVPVFRRCITSEQMAKER